MRLHREGFTIIFVTTLVLAILNFGVQWLLGEGLVSQIILGLSLFFFIMVVQFFRNPSRTTPKGEGLIIAPADGKVVVIENVEEGEYFKDQRKQVSIFMSPINVHVNRAPVSGKVLYQQYFPGKYLVAWHPKSSTENERTTAVIQMKNGTEILFRQIAGAVARRICWYLKEGDQVVQGDEFGFIKFGSRVDIFLPLTARVVVQPGQKTKGGKTIIATFT